MHFPASSGTLAGLTALLALPGLASSSFFFPGLSKEITPAHHEWQPSARHLHIRNETSTATNSSLAHALEIVAEAQAEARERNARLLANPRKNEYVLYHDRARPSDLLQSNGTISRQVSDGTGVNGTVGAALKLVSDATLKNKTILHDASLEKRGGSYWMENMVQNGASPYAPGGYKVPSTTSSSRISFVANMVDFLIGLA